MSQSSLPAFKKGWVSIVVPFHNRIELMKETLKSVSGQTYPRIELVLVDDFSANCDRIKMSSLYSGIMKYIRNEKQLGTGTSRQVGFEHCAGEYVIFLDSDDILHPNMVEESVTFLTSNPSVGMCYTTSKSFSISEELSFPDKLPVHQKSDRGITKEIIRESFTDGRLWDTSACAWQKKTLECFQPWFSLVGEDYVFESQIDTRGIPIGFINKPLCYYRIHPENASHRAEYSAKMLQILYVCNNIHMSSALSSADKKRLKIFLFRKLLKLKNRFKLITSDKPQVIHDVFFRFFVSWPLFRQPWALDVLVKSVSLFTALKKWARRSR